MSRLDPGALILALIVVLLVLVLGGELLLGQRIDNLSKPEVSVVKVMASPTPGLSPSPTASPSAKVKK